MKLRALFHRWTVFEDIVVAQYAIDRKTDPKSIGKLSVLLGLPDNKIAFRMTDFVKLIQDRSTDWHCSKQEKAVFDWLMFISKKGLSIKSI